MQDINHIQHAPRVERAKKYKCYNDGWIYFETLEGAKAYAEYIRIETGNILGIEENKDKVYEFFKKYFNSGLKDNLITYTLERDWLGVYYKNVIDFEGKEGRPKFLCAQVLRDYLNENGDIDELKLLDRMTLILCDKLKSLQQDINGIK